MRLTFILLFIITSVQYGFAKTDKHKKILIVATSADNRVSKPDDHTWGCYTPEVTCFFARLYQAGFTVNDVDIISLAGGSVPLAVKPSYPRKFPLPANEKLALEKKLKNALSPNDVNANDYDAIYYAGGFSCLVDLPTSDAIGKIAASIYNNGGIVAAVCDGVCGLLPIKLNNGQYLIRNKNLAVNNDLVTIRKQLVERGAILKKAKIVSEDRVVTAKGVKPIMVANELLILLALPGEEKK